MGYKNLQACIADLEANGHLIRIKEEVDPNLEMAAIHLRVFANNGPAILFENVKGCKFPCVSNLFGTLERSRFIFRDTIEPVKQLVKHQGDPLAALKSPGAALGSAATAFKALPKKTWSNPVLKNTCKISDLPQIKCWPDDGGAFVTLPQVYTEDQSNPGVMRSNLGMYRIQLSGNEYIKDKEIGLHYQLHRGIGIHQQIANERNEPLKVSIFVGGPPTNTFAAVMPLPEGLSELTFAGSLGGRRFRHTEKDGHRIASEADFVITGTVKPGYNKPEGPFGDHFGYYSLTHDFPCLEVDQVYHRDGAIWPFTVVGRPPQEDTQFGALIHELTGDILSKEVGGLHAVNAVDAAGVHPLLLATGSERYTPYQEVVQPQELLTTANQVLGFGQMSLAKYLIITEQTKDVNVNNIGDFFSHVLARVDWKRDIHFHTNTTIDTLDYSGDGLNTGSKVVIASVDKKIRTLGKSLPNLTLGEDVQNAKLVAPGIVAISGTPFRDYEKQAVQFERIEKVCNLGDEFPLIIWCDDADFVAASLNNFLWVTFTRSNPAKDMLGIDSFTRFKHWGCNGALVIDARTKPHHAPSLDVDPQVEARVDALATNGSLKGIT